jgi:ectoine hydroxylase-related dioxygenase (phytanoyl-CoA dioxygenase family)
MTSSLTASATARLTPADVRLEELAAVVEQTTELAAYPHADRVEQNVLVYDSFRLRAETATATGRDDVAAELVRALTDGPGVVVVEGAFPDHAVVDRVTAVFDEIIAEEEAAGGEHGDHFAAPGANSRVWNALEKLAVRAPEAFVDYYANDVIALASRAWLGPGYQVTSQVNVVRPGGKAQEPHRDYHLGFLTDDVVEQYPSHVHTLSPVLTLQGAVAHSDMPLESGPTLYLPYSQRYLPGYLAWRRDDVKAYFAEHHVQLPLRKGDAGFFNPALFHGAGTNVSADIQRMANLLQVSSAFGRAMEQVDRARVVNAVYPALRASGLGPDALARAIAASAEGYPFPTNLDLDQPVDGLTPVTQAELVHRALAEGWEPTALAAALDDYTSRRRTQDVSART